MNASNPLELTGIEFVEFAGVPTESFEKLVWGLGLSRTQKHRDKCLTHYTQNQIHFLLNEETAGFASDFAKAHGPSICSMGWRVRNAQAAYDEAIKRGAKPAPQGRDLNCPAISGIGDSLIYFVEGETSAPAFWAENFVPHAQPRVQESKGFLTIDHLTNNVPRGELQLWADFYKSLFGFTEVRYFNIEGAKTGLLSYALRSPDGSFCIPINEPKSDRDQIAEYLREYKGAGIQHLAFLTNDILSSLDSMRGSGIKTLEIDPQYYAGIFDLHPGVREDHKRIQDHQVLVDGDEKGYLLQIFTQNIIGPIFLEIIQRANNLSFGEGNFGALFRSIERDQERRGVI